MRSEIPQRGWLAFRHEVWRLYSYEASDHEAHPEYLHSEKKYRQILELILAATRNINWQPYAYEPPVGNQQETPNTPEYGPSPRTQIVLLNPSLASLGLKQRCRIYYQLLGAISLHLARNVVFLAREVIEIRKCTVKARFVAFFW